MSRMFRRTFVSAILALGVGACVAPLTGTGRRVKLAAFSSRHVSARDIDIWVPDVAPGRRMRVVYAHDGQNLFDPASSYSGVPWAIDAAMNKVAREGVEPALIVGIFNSPLRTREYHAAGIMPLLDQQTREAISYTCGGELMSDAYLKFVVEELKPYIDANFATRPARESTFMLGSSMGGLVSMEALRAYPGVFGGIGCLSAHTLLFGPSAADPGYRPPPTAADQIAAAMRAYATLFPVPGDQRIWIDRGTEELDGLYAPFQAAFVEGLTQRGYQSGRHLQARVFDKTAHGEVWWSARCDSVLPYLLA